MKTIRHLGALLVSIIVLFIALSGCDSLSPENGSVRTELRFGTVLPAAGKAASAVSGQEGKPVSRAVDLVTITEVKLLVKTVQFHNEEDDEEQEFKSESFVVTLQPGASASTVAVASVPPGTYDRVTFKIHKPEDGEEVPDDDFRDGPSGNERYSTVIRGAVAGEPFVLKLSESFQQRVQINPPLVVAEGDQFVNVTLLADVSAWFTGDDGGLLNPGNLDDADDIADAIKDSFRALSSKKGRGADDGRGGDDGNGDSGEDEGDE